jgi:hypothetical protein
MEGQQKKNILWAIGKYYLELSGMNRAMQILNRPEIIIMLSKPTRMPAAKYALEAEKLILQYNTEAYLRC